MNERERPLKRLATTIAILSSLLAGPANSGTTAVMSAETVASTAGAKRIQADVDFLADDLLEGREVGQRGYEVAARYVTARMRNLGLKPGTAAGFTQTVPLLSRQVRRGGGTDIDVGGRRLDHGGDVLVSASSAPVTKGDAVFAGYGLFEPSLGIDDYAGLDVRGKIVVVLAGFPTGFAPDVAAHLNKEKIRFAADRGAIGLVTVDTPTRERVYPWKERIENAHERAMTWVGPDGRPASIAPEIKGLATVSLAAAPVLFAGSARDWPSILKEIADLSARPHGFALKAPLAIAANVDSQMTRAPNVIGLIEGSDPRLRGEVVVLSAHLDHLGLAEEGKDRVFNGALDNAMGVSVLLEVARALQADPPPRRSVAIVALAAEEKGLVGSDYLAHFPPFGPRHIVADINIDMPVLLGKFTGVLAFGAEHSSLGATVARAARSIGVAMVPDSAPEQAYFTRSDQYSFVRAGIPAVKLNPQFDRDGAAREAAFRKSDYHHVTDSADLPIWWNQADRFAMLNLAIARDAANRPESPSWRAESYFGKRAKRLPAAQNRP